MLTSLFILLMSANPTMADHNLSLYSLNNFFLKNGLQELDTQGSGNNKLLGVDQVWVSQNLSKVIYLKLSDESKIKRSLKKIKYDFGTLVTTKIFQQKSAAFFFVGFKENEIDILTKKLKAKSNRAPASEASFCLDCLTEAEPNILNQSSTLRQLTQSLEAPYFLQATATCGNIAYNSAKSSIKDTYHFIGASFNFGKDLFLNPKAAWKTVVTSFETLKSIASELQAQIKNIGPGIANASTEIKAQIACGMAGSLAPDIALNLSGIGTASLISKISQYILKLKNIASILKVYKEIENLGLKTVELTRFIQNYLTKGFSAKQITLFENLSTYPTLAAEALKCAI